MAVPRQLETERLVLRQWRPEDVEPLAAIYAEPEFLEHMPALDLEGTRRQVERMSAEWGSAGFSHWAVDEKASGRLIGRVGLMRHVDWTPGGTPVEVGWSIGRDFYGNGYATEAGGAAVECWREHLPDDDPLICITTPANHRSRAVAERLGMILAGSTHWHGYDVIYYSLHR